MRRRWVSTAVGLFLALVLAAGASAVSVEDKLTFENDFGVFMMFTLMNLTGYDWENYHAGFTEVRQYVYDRMKDVDLESLGIPSDFFIRLTDWGLAYDAFYAAAPLIGDPPDFSYAEYRGTSEWDLFHAEEELGHNLTRFLQILYRETDIAEIFEEVRPYYDAVIAQYEAEAYPIVNELVTHFRIDPSELKHTRLFVNLLDSAWFGITITRESTWEEVHLFSGPIPEGGANVRNAIHEFSHTLTSPVIRNSARAKSLAYFIKRESGNPWGDGYPDWLAIIDESFVRAFTAYFFAKDRSLAESETESGFLLTAFVYDRIPTFDPATETLPEFIDRVIFEFHRVYEAQPGDYEEEYDIDTGKKTYVDESLYYEHVDTDFVISLGEGGVVVFQIYFNGAIEDSPGDVDIICLDVETREPIFLDVSIYPQDSILNVQTWDALTGRKYQVFLTSLRSKDGVPLNSPTTFVFEVRGDN